MTAGERLPGSLSLTLSDRTALFLAAGALLFAAALAATILLTPAWGLPAGVATTDGISMGHQEAHVYAYVDVDASVGDVVVYEAGERGFLGHRIVGETSEGYVTQGDNERYSDQYAGGYAEPAPHATEGNIRGVVVYSAPLSSVQGGILGLLALLGLLGAALYRRQLSSALRRLTQSNPVQLRQAAVIVFSVLLTLSIVGPGVILLPGVDSDHSGTAAAYDLSTATANHTVDVTGYDAWPQDLTFNDDGTKAYLAGNDADTVYQLTLSTPWDLSTASQETTLTDSGFSTPNDLVFRDNGNILYVHDQNNNHVIRFDLSTAYDISTASKTSTWNPTEISHGFDISPDGTVAFTTNGDTPNSVRKYELSTAHDLSTASYVTQYDVSGSITDPYNVEWHPNGDRFYVVGQGSNNVVEYSTGTNWGFSSVSQVNSISETNPIGASFDKGGEKLHVTWDLTSTTQYDTNTYGNPVSGTVTDSDGNPLEAAVTLEQDGVQVDSTTTDGSGNYLFDSISDGSYTVVAEADGYVSQSESITVSGSEVTQNITLEGNYGGQVVTQEGAPCEDCLVELWMVNDANTTTDAGETVKEAQEDAVDNLSRGVPRDLFEPDTSVVDDVLHGGQDTEAVLLHSPKAWEEPVADFDIPLTNYRYSVYSTGNSLEVPTNQVEPGETYIASCWEPQDGGIGGAVENAVDNSIDPGRTTSCNISVEQIGPGNSTVQSRELQTEEAFTTGSYAWKKEHHAVELTLPEGYWRVSSTESPATTVVRSGSPERMPRAIEHGLEGADGNPANIAQEIQKKIDDGQFARTTVETDANGRFKYPVPSGYSTVAVTAFSGQGMLESYQDPTIADLRTEIQRDDYNRSVYLSQKPKVTHPPDSDVKVVVREVTNPTFEDIESYLSRLQWFQELIDTEHYTDTEGLFTDAPSDVSTGDYRERVDELNGIIDAQRDLLESARGSMGNYDGVANNPEDASEQELKEALEAQEKALSEQQSSIENLRDTVTDLQEQEDGPTLLNMEVPFKSNSLDKESTSVVVQWANGSTTTMNRSYWSVSSGSASDPAGSAQYDYVQIEEYPLPSDASVANIRVVTANEEGVGQRTERVENPAFPGDVPRIEAISANTLRPGPSERVRLRVDAAERSSYHTIQSAQAYAPNGSELTVGVSGDEIEFNAAGAGNHLVKLNLEDTDGNVYTETLRVKAGEQDAPMPPGVRIREGITGIHALAGDGVDSARVRVDEQTRTARIGAVFPEEHGENVLHVYAGDALQGTEGTYRVRALEGEDERANGEIEVQIHTSALSEDAHIYRDGSKPITDGKGTAAGRVVHNTDGSRIQTYTNSNGEVVVDYNNAPGYLDGFRWWALTNVPGLTSLPGAQISLGGALVEAAQTAAAAITGFLPDMSTVQSGFFGAHPWGGSL